VSFAALRPVSGEVNVRATVTGAVWAQQMLVSCTVKRWSGGPRCRHALGKTKKQGRDLCGTQALGQCCSFQGCVRSPHVTAFPAAGTPPVLVSYRRWKHGVLGVPRASCSSAWGAAGWKALQQALLRCSGPPTALAECLQHFCFLRSGSALLLLTVWFTAAVVGGSC